MMRSFAGVSKISPIVLIAIVAAMAAGYYAIVHTPIDAIPDIGEKQVIVYVDWPGRSPQDVDDQVTYPLDFFLFSGPPAEVRM